MECLLDVVDRYSLEVCANLLKAGVVHEDVDADQIAGKKPESSRITHPEEAPYR
jgi:hypothetical protein